MEFNHENSQYSPDPVGFPAVGKRQIRKKAITQNPKNKVPTMRSLITYTFSYFCLILLILLSLSMVPAVIAQPLKAETETMVRAQIEEEHRREQNAFIEGDCNTVVSFYSDEATIYRDGRRVEDMSDTLEFCRNLPRPFTRVGGQPEISDSFYVLSENAVHFVRTIDFAPTSDESPAFKREVITKVWEKLNGEWKIVHFHSSVHSVSDE